MTQATISILGQQVNMIYCAATETGYETMTDKSSDIFSPSVTTDEQGERVVNPPKAKLEDYIYLAMAAIVAASTKEHAEVPVKSEDILYEAKPNELTEIVSTIVRLRNEWYVAPSLIKQKEETMPEEEEQPKNA